MQSIERIQIIRKDNVLKSIAKRIRKVDFKELNTKLYNRQRVIADFIKRGRTVKVLHLMRHYSALIVVISSAFLVTATNIASGNGSNNLLLGYWDSGQGESGTLIASNNAKKNKVSQMPLSKAGSAVDPNMKEEVPLSNSSQNQSIIASASTSNPQKDPEEDGGIKMYIVEQGDTLSSIAVKNKVSMNTLLWANDISNVDSIMPGDTLFILPVSGIQYVVKKGDNIDAVAEKFKADKAKIISFNDLAADGSLDEGKTIVIPDGQGEKPKPKPEEVAPAGIERRQYANATGGVPQVSGFKTPENDGKAGKGHSFPYGYCTWYVAQKRFVPWSGNAGAWLFNAKMMGYKTGRTPQAGAIMVTTENKYYGHVALVEKVSGDTITISEMNYTGWGKTSHRTLSASSRAIKGFIY